MSTKHECINEQRLCQLEKEGAAMGTDIKNLVKSLDNLTDWIKGLVLCIIPCTLGCLGFLFWQAITK